MDELRLCFQTMGCDPLVGCEISLQGNQHLKKINGTERKKDCFFTLAVNC